MENVKYKDFPEERFCKNDRSNKRFIMTEPYEWTSNDSRPFPSHTEPISKEEKTQIKHMFTSDSVVLSSLNKRKNMIPQTVFEPNTVKHDRVAESTLYHECEEDTTFKHQNSVTILRGQPGKNNYSEQEYLIPKEEQESEENEVNMFEAKISTGKSSKNEPKKKTKPTQKRLGSSEKRPGAGKSNNARKNGK
jgi:hypothetical protein